MLMGLGGGGGGGGSVFHPDFFVKLYFEKAVDHQCPLESHALIWSIFGSILPDHLKVSKAMLRSDLLVATTLLNTQINFYKNGIKIGYMTIFGHTYQI